MRKTSSKTSLWDTRYNIYDKFFFLFIDNESRKELKLLHTAVGHIGGVKDISFLSSMTPKQKQHGNQQKHKQHLNGHFVSCGSRTSLKKWSLACPNFTAIPLSTILDATQEYDGCIGESDDVTCCLQSEIFNPEMNPKQLRLRTGEFIDDMRFMSCDSCFLNDDNSNNSDVIVCVCACSDGAVRLVVALFDTLLTFCGCLY